MKDATVATEAAITRSLRSTTNYGARVITGKVNNSRKSGKAHMEQLSLLLAGNVNRMHDTSYGA